MGHCCLNPFRLSCFEFCVGYFGGILAVHLYVGAPPDFLLSLGSVPVQHTRAILCRVIFRPFEPPLYGLRAVE